ncbi:MAG: tandem-95 repeat protein [Bacteroidales bacterium]|nr:tandem-95 repeat protein [Bacteroidales bacterium]
MKSLYKFRMRVISITLLLFMSLISFTQEKLSEISNVTTTVIEPKVYSQPVTNDRTTITEGVQINTDVPLFIQKFNGDNSSELSVQTKDKFSVPAQSENSFYGDPLPVDESGFKSGGNLSTVPCDGIPIGINDLFVTGNDRVLSIVAPGFLANDIDREGEALTATAILDNVDHGSLVAFGNGSFTYTPDEGFTGTDQFIYRMRDASNNFSDSVTVTIEVFERSNRTPIGSDDIYGALSGTVLSIAAPGFLANDIDQDGDALTATAILDNVDHGSLAAFGNGSFTYTPETGFIGTDQFSYRMRDSENNFSDTVTVTIQVFLGNRNPVGTDDLFGVVLNTPLNISAPGFLTNDIDPDGDVLTATAILDNVDHGSLAAFGNGSFIYTPETGFTGTDQFQYRMRDSENNFSDTVTVTLEVIGAGDLPVGFADTYQTADGSILSIAAPGFLLNDIDQNGEPLTATSIDDNVDNGTLAAFADGSFSYTPNPGFTGIDQFQYIMRDASLNMSEAITVTILVGESYNRVPIGIDDQYGGLANTTLSIASPGFLSNDIDQDGEAITATAILDNVDHGSLAAFADGSFIYTPNAGFLGTDQFKYRMRDASNNFSDTVTVTIEVYEGNRIPLGTDDIYGVVKNTALNMAAPGFLTNDYDPDGDNLTATAILDNVDHGTLAAFADGSFVYTPEAGFTGTDQFQYRMRDALNNFSDTVTVQLEVIGPNEPPVAISNNITAECTGQAGTTVLLDGSGSYDPEGGNLIYTWYENNNIIAGPTGSATSDYVFTTGMHQVTLMVEDECGQTSQADITVTVEDTNGPIVEADFLGLNQPHTFEIFCSAEDLCGDVISAVSVILIPELTNPKVNLKNNNNYSLMIDTEKNTVSVKAPDAAAFWTMILANEGVPVNNGQVISAKDQKNKYKFSFDNNGNLVSVMGEIVTLRCTATDEYGNTGVAESTLPMDLLKSVESTVSNTTGEEVIEWHRNFPNPFANSTTIEFKLEKSAIVNIYVHDQMGSITEQLESKFMPEGVHQINWDASQHNPGIYFYRIVYDGNQVSGKMIYRHH